MEIPQAPSADLSKLKSILQASKAIMNKVETKNYTTGHIDSRALNEDGVKLLENDPSLQQRAPQNVVPVGGFTEDQINNSKLPDVVKRAMLERPIPQATMAAFTLDDVADLQEKPMGFVQTPKTNPRQNQQPINEGRNSDTITVSKEQLREMVNALVNEKLLEHYTKAANKKITEETVNKTISMMIKEGKLTPVKKKTL